MKSSRVFRVIRWLLVVPTGTLAGSLRDDVTALTRGPHRLAGTAEGAAAADHVARRLRGMGLEVYEQAFTTAQTRTLRCELTSGDDARWPLRPLRPNGIIPAVSPPEGFTGRLLSAEASDLTGAIAVVRSGDDWLRCFRRGARAVIFVGTPGADGLSTHVDANATLPRFHFPGEPAALPFGQSVTLYSEVIWERVTGRNVLALVRGRAPEDERPRSLLVVAAPLDSFGHVPELSPGARGAANVAALLSLAGSFASAPADGDLLFAFFDQEARGHGGAHAFYRTIAPGDGPGPEQHLTWRREEKAQLEALLTEARNVGAQQRPGALLRERLRAIGTTEVAQRREADTNPTPAARAERERWNSLLRWLDGKEALPSEELRRAKQQLQQSLAARLAEIEIEQVHLEQDAVLAQRLGKRLPTAHVSLQLGDGGSKWGLLFGGNSMIRSELDVPGTYSRWLTLCGEAVRSAGHLDTFVRATLEDPDLGGGSLKPTPWLIHSSEIAGTRGVSNFVLGTLQDRALREGTPADSAERLDLGSVERQAADMAAFLRALTGLDLPRQAVLPHVALDAYPRFNALAGVQGPRALGRSPGSVLPNVPLAGVVVQFRHGHTLPTFNAIKPPAYDDFTVAITDANGCYTVPLYHSSGRRYGWSFAARFDMRGEVESASVEDTRFSGGIRVVLASVTGGAIVPAPTTSDKSTTKVFGLSGSVPIPTAQGVVEARDGVVAWFAPRRFQSLALFGIDEAVVLGSGLNSATAIATLPRSARDLWTLDEARLRLLRERNIFNHSLEDLHSRASNLISAPAAEAADAAAFLLQKPVYEQTRATLNDLVHTALILLLLALPFAFVLERLLVNSANIYRQLAWFAGLFAATFGLLRASHPAFAIAQSPLIILIGFAIVALSSVVIVIVMGKFQRELRAVQGGASRLHVATLSRSSAVFAATTMSIATMRRRPLRTALTALTVVLLTCTMLFFASFERNVGVISPYEQPLPGHTGVHVHHAAWREFDPAVADLWAARWIGEAETTRRWWLSPRRRPAPDRGLVLSRTDGASPVRLAGALGLEAAELARRPDLTAVLGTPDDFERTVWFTAAVATRLGVKPGDLIQASGHALQVGPLLAPEQLSRWKDMDGSSVVPLNLERSEMQLVVASASGNDVAAGAWEQLPYEDIAIVPARIARLAGATLHAFTLYTADLRAADLIAREAVHLGKFPIAVTRASGVHLEQFGVVMAAAGFGDLFFPILLGGLVIVGTMMGSVADREREIYTFSALGLAPPHVAGLFLAEAMVYACLGGLGGYLLAQGVLQGINILADYGWVRPPEVNQSSTNAIFTLLLVMGTVLASSIYPAIRAARSANPGIQRAWRLPTPDGDQLELVFPFTVAESDAAGIMGFIHEYIEQHRDTSVGVFMAASSARTFPGEGYYGLTAEIALAPFDLGVTQRIQLETAAGEIPQIQLVHFRAVRQSGEPRDWHRLNKAFLDELRRQFLLWRALSPEAMAEYGRTAPIGTPVVSPEPVVTP